jgi:hypothetical protein
LESVGEERDRLVVDLASNRRELDSMLETLRRKEKQFADERKQLQRKNKELAEVFDMFAERTGAVERRIKCAAVRKDQLNAAIMSCRSTDDVGTQTDDVTTSALQVGSSV